MLIERGIFRQNTDSGIPIKKHRFLFHWILVYIVALAGLHPHSAEGSVRPPDWEGKYIDEITISGIESVPESDIRGVIRMKEFGLFNRSQFDTRLLRLDAIGIKTFYQSQGFLGVAVQDSFTVLEHGVNVFLTIYEGKRYYLASADIEGNTSLSDKKIRELLGFKIGDPYDPVTANENISLVEAEYQRIGKLFNRVLITDEIQDSVHVKVSITEGPDIYLNHIFVEGLEGMDSSLVTREFKIAEGDLYNKDDIDLTRQRLLETGVFSFVGISPVVVSGSDTLVNLLLELRHFKPREWISEGGYYPIEYYEGLEPIPGAGVQIEWRNRSLNHTTTNFSTQLTGDAVYADGKVRPKVRLEMSFSNQWIFKVRFPTEIQLYYESFTHYSKIGEPLILRYGAIVSGRRTFSPQTYFESGLRWDKFIQPENTQSDVEQRTIKLEGQWGRTDNPLYPTRGYLMTGETNWTGGILGGNRDFLKLDAGINGYLPLPLDWVIAGRIKYGKIFGWDQEQYQNDVRYDLFYLGGSTSLRAWDILKLNVDDAGNPQGDIIRLLANMEFRFPLFWLLGGELFLDAGYLTDKPRNIRLDTLNWNWGGGLSIRTPLGPLRLDIAFPYGDYAKWKIQLGVHYIF